MRAKTLLLSAALLTAAAGFSQESAATNSVVQYADEVITLRSVIPAENTELESIGLSEGGRTYTFDTSINAQIAYISASWFDVTNGREWIDGADAEHELGSDTPLTLVKTLDRPKMYMGHTYELVVTCYDSYAQPRTELGYFTVTYKGATPDYTYATQQATSVNPNPQDYVITSAEEAHFTVTFDAAVEVDNIKSHISLGPLGNDYYESITPNDDKTEWTFVIPSHLLDESTVVCFVLATDSEGRTVRGNEEMARYESGLEENSGFIFEYNCEIGGAELIVTPEEGAVTSLQEFRITVDGAQDMVPSWTAYPYLVKGRETVYSFNLESDADISELGTVVLTMPEEVTEDGEYVLIIPAGTFECEMNVETFVNNKAAAIHYTIGGTSGEVTYDYLPESITPAEGEVPELTQVDFHFADVTGVLLFDAYLMDAEGKEVCKTDICYDDDWNNETDLHVYFNPAITEPGTYTLVIPEGSFCDEENITNTDSGRQSPEIRVSYTITETSVELISTEVFGGDVYNVAGVLIMRNATADDIRNLDKGIYIVGGKKIAVK